MEKTIQGWLNLLSECVRKKALYNIEKQFNHTSLRDKMYPNLRLALTYAFNWNDTDEGYIYWDKISLIKLPISTDKKQYKVGDYVRLKKNKKSSYLKREKYFGKVVKIKEIGSIDSFSIEEEEGIIFYISEIECKVDKLPKKGGLEKYFATSDSDKVDIDKYEENLNKLTKDLKTSLCNIFPKKEIKEKPIFKVLEDTKEVKF